MSREQVSTEFDCRRISVIVHRSASDKLAALNHSLVLLVLGRVLFRSKKEKECLARFPIKDLCLANSLSVKIYTVICTL